MKKFSDEQKMIIEEGLFFYQECYHTAKVDIEFKKGKGFGEYKDIEFESAHIITTIAEGEWHDIITGEQFIHQRHGHYQEPELNKNIEYYWTTNGWKEKNAPKEVYSLYSTEVNMLSYFLYEIQNQLNIGNEYFDLLSLRNKINKLERERKEFFKKLEMRRMKRKKKEVVK